MKVDAKIRLYDIKKCGYYIGSSRVFASIPEVFADLQNWVSSKSISSTQTFTVDEDSSFLPVYCADVAKNSGSNDWLLVLWNETGTHDGKHATVGARDSVGSANVTTIEVADDTIPGFPTYFLILGSKKLILSIQFYGKITGKSGFDRYIKGFLERCSMWVQTYEDEKRSLDSEIAGYAKNNSDEIDSDISPEFSTNLGKAEGDLAYIRKNRPRIRKLHRKSIFNNASERSTHAISSLFKEFVGCKPTKTQISHSKFKFDIDFQPTEKELEDIIETWDEKPKNWGDVGFSFVGESTKKWLSSMLLTDTLKLDLELDDDDGLYGAEDLLNELLKHKDHIVKLGSKSKNK